jgi:hypothetical protein
MASAVIFLQLKMKDERSYSAFVCLFLLNSGVDTFTCKIYGRLLPVRNNIVNKS